MRGFLSRLLARTTTRSIKLFAFIFTLHDIHVHVKPFDQQSTLEFMFSGIRHLRVISRVK